jgi:hypothetical protein
LPIILSKDIKAGVANQVKRASKKAAQLRQEEKRGSRQAKLGKGG